MKQGPGEHPGFIYLKKTQEPRSKNQIRNPNKKKFQRSLNFEILYSIEVGRLDFDFLLFLFLLLFPLICSFSLVLGSWILDLGSWFLPAKH